MTLRAKVLAATLLSLGLTTVALADESVYVFHRPDFKVDRQDKPIAKPAGEIELKDGVKVPVFSLAMVNGASDDKEVFRPRVKKLDLAVKPELASRLVAYASPMGIILVPKNWQAWSAAIGVDGSASLLFAPDASGQNFLSYDNSGACVGCALSAASLYFDEAKKRAQQDDFATYRRPPALKMVKLNQFIKAYNIAVSSGNPVDGLAYFNHESDYEFFDARVSLGKDNHDLATVLLNQFKDAVP